MVVSRQLILLALFAITCRASSPQARQPSSALQAHALLRREENASNASGIPAVEESSGVRSSRFSNTSTHEVHEDEGQERALLSRVHPRSSLQLKEDPEDEEEEVLDSASGLPMPKECRHSFIKSHFCDIKMWDSTYRVITGIRGNYRFQCDVENFKPGDVVRYPKFAVVDGQGICSFEKKMRSGEIVPRWGVPVNRSCNVNCNGFRIMGAFRYMKAAVQYVECEQVERPKGGSQQQVSENEDAPPEAVEGGQAFSFFQEDPETGELVPAEEEFAPNLVARFSVDLNQICIPHSYVYLYIALAIVFIGFLVTGVAMFTQWRKRHIGRDEDEWR